MKVGSVGAAGTQGPDSTGLEGQGSECYLEALGSHRRILSRGVTRSVPALLTL